MASAGVAGLQALWSRYQAQLVRQPVRTQVISSGLLWAVGDVIAQTVEHTVQRRQSVSKSGRTSASSSQQNGGGTTGETNVQEPSWDVDIARAAKTSLFGFGFVGPVGHYWYEGLEYVVKNKFKFKPNSRRFIGTKLALDIGLFGPIHLWAFFTYMGLASGKSLPEVKGDIQRDFLPTFMTEGTMWLLVQVANFRLVPVTIACFIRTCIPLLCSTFEYIVPMFFLFLWFLDQNIVSYEVGFTPGAGDAGMKELWKRYQAQLIRWPVRTQAITSGLIWAAGDVIAQTVETTVENRQGGYELESKTSSSSECSSPVLSDSGNLKGEAARDERGWRLNLSRVAKTSFFGFGVVGPVGHFWYLGLEYVVKKKLKLKPNSRRFVGTKVLIDGVLFGPMDLLIFFTYMGLASGKSLPEVRSEIQRDFPPTIMTEGVMWLLVQFANFRYVPVRNQLLVVNCSV